MTYPLPGMFLAASQIKRSPRWAGKLVRWLTCYAHSPSDLDSLMLTSAGSANPASISTALTIPTGTGQAAWLQCLAAS